MGMWVGLQICIYMKYLILACIITETNVQIISSYC